MKANGSEMLALKMGQGTLYQGMQEASGGCQRKKIDSALEPLRRNGFCH